MAIKAEVKKEKLENSYPFIGKAINDNCIVLFTSHGQGTILVSSSGGLEIGYTTKSWDMNFFKKLDGSITLSNE